MSLEELAKTGVLYIPLGVDDYLAKLERICAERQYKNRDEIWVSPEKLPNYEEKIKSFFQECAWRSGMAPRWS